MIAIFFSYIGKVHRLVFYARFVEVAVVACFWKIRMVVREQLRVGPWVVVESGLWVVCCRTVLRHVGSRFVGRS